MSAQTQVSPKNADSIMNDPTFVNSFQMLLWKDFKQQTIRRPISTCCRIFLPVAFILLLGLIRVQYDTQEFSDTIYNPFSNNFKSTQTNADTWPITSVPSLNNIFTSANLTELGINYNIRKELTCFKNLIEDAPTLPAYSIAFVPDPTSQAGSNLNDAAFAHYVKFIELLNKTYAYVNDGSTATSADTCSSSTLDLLKLPFEKGWLLRYFNSDSELQDYVKHPGYGNGYQVSAELDDKRPIGFAVVVNSISDDGLQWVYIIFICVLVFLILTQLKKLNILLFRLHFIFRITHFVSTQQNVVIPMM